jgi:hypothetical protein
MKVLLPEANRKDLDDVPAETAKVMEFRFAGTICRCSRDPACFCPWLLRTAAGSVWEPARSGGSGFAAEQSAMKGDVVNLTRVIAFRLALAAFILSLVALSIYWAGNLQELSDPALFVTMDWAVGASICGIVLAALAVSCCVAPFFMAAFPL